MVLKDQHSSSLGGAFFVSRAILLLPQQALRRAALVPGAAIAGRHVRTYPCSGTCYLLRVGRLSLCLSDFMST